MLTKIYKNHISPIFLLFKILGCYIGQPLVYEYSREGIVPFEKEGSYICLPSESNGPNLLDEPLSGFIWFSGVWV
jgi:hypothetical protein